ncbi:DUF6504 family protein [Enterovirga sp.]|uniref:DUF6504 family protein n=1 Tax=Enterovirga sp. TaxID=2026350 RepID=UPI0026255B2F|nr:DUF6504 family protein [Enterovirga sp.]MDB5590709.1 hypothetical protein [Enterovirga sp.]
MCRDGARRLVAAVDEAAWTLGVRPGQPVAQVQASIAGLAVVEAVPEEDAAELAGLARWCGRYGPVVQPDPPAGLLLDVEGSSHLFGGEAALMADALRRLRLAGFAAEAGLADTPGAAWALARYRPGQIVARGRTGKALAGLPVAALRLPADTVRGLQLLGIDRVEDLARLPRPDLARRFGRELLDRHDRALGRAADPLSPLVPDTVLQVRLAFPEPLTHLAGIEAALARLLPQLCRELDRRRGGLRRLDAVLRRVDGQPLGFRVGTAAPSRDAAHLGRLVAERLPGLDPGFGIDEIVLAAGRVEPLPERQIAAGDLAGPAGDGEAVALAPLVDRLAVRLGASRIFRAAPVESRIPERSVGRVAPLAPLGTGSWPTVLPRPSRLIEPPERVTAMAVVPDEPPASFTWRGVRHVVRAADGPERVRGEWWRADAEAESLRDYYRVEDTAGRRFWLFRDASMAENGQWWLHGRFA